MQFEIYLLDNDPLQDYSEQCLREYKEIYGDRKLAESVIRIGDFQETLWTSLAIWNRDDYINHWQESLDMLIKKKERSVFITSLDDSSIERAFCCRQVWLVDEEYRFHNLFWCYDDLPDKFDPKNPYLYIPPYPGKFDEDGDEVAEWCIPVSSFIQ